MATFFFTVTSESAFNTEFKTYVNIPSSLGLDTVQPAMLAAQNNTIRPLIGDEFTDELLAALEGTPTEPQTKAIAKIQEAVAHLTTIELLPFLNVKMGQGGITQSNNQNESPAEYWQTRDLKRRLENNANQSLDRLLRFLDKNASDYTTYEDSEAHKAANSNFCNDLPSATKVDSLINSFFVLQHLRPAMTRADEGPIQSILGEELYNHLKTVATAGDSWGDYEPLQKFIHRIEISTALAESVETNRVSLDTSFGLHIRLIAEVETGRKADQLDIAARETLVRKHNQHATAAAVALVSELKANTLDYPLWVAPTAPTRVEPAAGSSMYTGFGIPKG